MVTRKFFKIIFFVMSFDNRSVFSTLLNIYDESSVSFATSEGYLVPYQISLIKLVFRENS